MSVHRSDDGKRLAAYAQWRCQAELFAAVGSPEARAGHGELAHCCASDGGALYADADVFGPHTGGETPEVRAQSAIFEQALSGSPLSKEK
jgi:hypothetical protein